MADPTGGETVRAVLLTRTTGFAMTAPGLCLREPLLGSLTVADSMQRGIVTLSPSASLRDVASTMAEHGTHAVLIAEDAPADAEDDGLWGVVSDVDLMRGIGSTVSLDAGKLAALAALDVFDIGAEEPLAEAARLMAEHEVSYIVVVEDGRPAGVLSTHDIARVAAGEEAREPVTAGTVS
jgi:CBS domain-containing protein